MIEETTWSYKRFLIVEHPAGVVKAYRNPMYWDGETTSYEAKSRTDIEQMIDDAEDGGEFEEEHQESSSSSRKSRFLEKMEAPPPKYEVGDEVEFTGMVRWMAKGEGVPKLRSGLRGEITDVHRGTLGYTSYDIQLLPSEVTPEGLKLVDISETAFGVTLIRKV